MTREYTHVEGDTPPICAEVVRHGSEDKRFSNTKIRVSRLVTEFGMWIADLRWHIDWEATNYVQRAATILTAPTWSFTAHRIIGCRSR